MTVLIDSSPCHLAVERGRRSSSRPLKAILRRFSADVQIEVLHLGQLLLCPDPYREFEVPQDQTIDDQYFGPLAINN